MNRAELVAALSKELGKTQKECEKIVETELDIIIRALQSGDFVRIAGFGRLDTKTMPPRMCHDPRNGNVISVGTVRKPVFKSGKNLRKAINVGIPEEALKDDPDEA